MRFFSHNFRSAYLTNIKERADFVRWSPTGTHYIVGFYKHVDVYSVSDAAVLFTIKTSGRCNDLAFLDDTSFAVAGESPNVEVYSLVDGSLQGKFEAHQNRVRCLAVIAEESTSRCCMVTASNDGMVKVWSVTRCKDEVEAQMVASVNTNCRVTCMIVHRVPDVVAQETKADTKVAVKRAASPDDSGDNDLVEDEADEDVPKKKKKKKVKVVDEKQSSTTEGSKIKASEVSKASKKKKAKNK